MSFALSYLSLGEQLVLLYTSGTRHLINETLVSVLHAHLRHLDLAVRADKVPTAFTSSSVVDADPDQGLKPMRIQILVSL